jgi:hypothetical protein
MPAFRPKPDYELDRLSNEDLIAYANAARGAGEHEHWRLAISILVFGFQDRVKIWILRKAHPSLLEDLMQEVFTRALTSLSRESAEFQGRTGGEFGSWLRQITAFVIADHTDAAKRERANTQAPPPDPEGDLPELQVPDPAGDDFTDSFANRELAKEAYETVTNPSHRKLIGLIGPADYGFKGLSAEEAVESMNAELEDGTKPMSEANAYKIISRYRASLNTLREGGNA